MPSENVKFYKGIKKLTSTSHNRVETERVIPKLKFVLTKRTLGEYGNSL